MADSDLDSSSHDAQLKRTLGFWSLLATGVGSVIGSGWLLAANAGANAAGPAVLVAWVIGGALMLMIALVFAELGMTRPESGGLVRYPLYANGRLPVMHLIIPSQTSVVFRQYCVSMIHVSRYTRVVLM